MKKILAIIPARSGSKGLPNKNILPLWGKPLLYYSIEAAKQSGIITKTIVSTDSEDYRKIAISYGAEVPFLRPKDLAEDSSSIADVIHHTLEYFKKKGESFDLVLLLQPTSPLRRAEHIKEAVEKYEREAVDGDETLVSVVKAPLKSKWLLDKKNNYINFCFDINLNNPQRQHLTELYLPNGALYIASVKHFDKSFYTDKTLSYEMSEADSTDIDTIEDFQVAEMKIKELVEKYQPEFLYFIDDSFTARPKNEVLEFCDMYEEFKIPFWFNTRPETTTEQVLRRLKEVGAYRISFGIEAGNEEYRKNILQRNTSNKKLQEHFDAIIEVGIPFSLNLIIGFPGETRDLIMDTIKLTKSIGGYDTITCSIFTPYHGSILREVAIKNGWLDANYITKHTTSNSPLKMPPPYLSSADIDGIMRVISLMCYFPESEWPRLKRAEIDDEEGNKILQEYSEIYQREFLKDHQEIKKYDLMDFASGCKSNELDGFRFFTSPKRMEAGEYDQLKVEPVSFIKRYR